MPKRKEIPLFYRFIAYYLLLLVVPVSACLYVYFNTEQIIERNLFRSHIASLTQNIQRIEKEFQQVEDTAYSLQTNLAVTQFVHTENPYDDRTKLVTFNQVTPYLRPYLTVNPFFSKIFLYSGKSGALVSDRFVSLDLTRLYPRSFSVTGMDVEAFRSDFLESPYEGAYLYGIEMTESRQTSRYVVYARRITQGYPYNANCFIFIREDNILSLLRKTLLDEQSDSFVRMRTREGYLLSDGISPEDSASVDNQEPSDPTTSYSTMQVGTRMMFVVQGFSEKYGFRITCGMPMDRILRELTASRRILLLMMAFSFLISLVLAIYLAYRQVIPLKGMMERVARLFNQKEVSYTYDFMNSQLSELMSHSTALREEMLALQPLQRNSILHALVNGEYATRQAVADNLRMVGIEPEARLYCVLMIILNDIGGRLSFEEQSAWKLMVGRTIDQHALGVAGLLTIDAERQAVILLSDEADKTAFIHTIEQFAQTIIPQLKAELDISLSISGSLSEDLEDLPVLYREAKAALEYAEPINDLTVLWFRKASDRSDRQWSFSNEEESALIEAVSHGNAKRCGEILRAIHRNNFRIRRLEDETQIAFLDSLCVTLLRLKESLPDMSDSLTDRERLFRQQVREADSQPETLFLSLAEYLEGLCAAVHRPSKKHVNPLAERIVAYIDAQFDNPQLSLAFVADRFGITEVYLSKLIKQHLNQNYTKYVEALRMDKANRLLGENVKIALVSDQCGFNSLQTFRRVYRQHFGAAPKEGVVRARVPEGSDQQP